MCFAGTALAQQQQAYVPGEIIVRLKSEHGSAESYTFMGKATSDKGMNLKASWSKMKMYHYGLPHGKTVEAAVAELKRDPNVAYVEPNYYLSKTADPVGMQQTFSAEQIHATSLQAQSGNQAQSVNLATSAPIGVQSIWNSGTAVPSERPIVAVIDTGLDANHYVIQGTDALWTNPGEIAANGIDDDANGYIDDVHGWNFVAGNNNPNDDDDHGTHVTGIILSVDQDIFASPLRQSRIQIMPLKFLDSSGVGTTANAIRAIYYAANNGASVLNNSWGGSTYSSALAEAIAYSYSKGALFVAAAGNLGENNDSQPMYPASYEIPNVISVAATTEYDSLASFSNFGGGTVHLGSPGVYILSTIPGDQFATCSGTSMATPFVAGTAAQMKVESPAMLPYQLRQILLGQTSRISSLDGKVTTNGRLESANAVTYAKTASVMGTQPAFTYSYSGADRELASAVGGAGCGLVKALDGGDKGGPPIGGSGLMILGVILLPLVVLLAIRARAPENRRKHDRFKINSDVRISVGDRELVGSISSLSLGGVQLNTSALLQDGGMVTLSIASPDGQERVEVAGRVVWSAANKAYGVAFDHAPQSALSRMADWTRGLKRSA
jgi:subtilisin family serine protease